VTFRARASFDGTAAGLLDSMDRAGIDRAVVCSVATKPEQVPKITAWAAALASDRFVPFASIHPDFPDPEGEVERVASAGLVGLKFHAQYMGCPADDPRAERIARAAAQVGLVMAFHAGHDMGYPSDDLASPRRLRRLHERVPDLRLLVCHMGGWQSWNEALEHLIGTEMYVETSMTQRWCPPDLLARLFEGHGPGRILFGTDAPWSDQAESLAAFLALPLDADRKRRILWDNALAFLGEAPVGA